MKKQLANYFDIIPRDDVIMVEGVVTPKAGKTSDRFLTKNNPSILDQVKDVSGNTYYEQSSKMVCGKLSSEMRARYIGSRPVIVFLYYGNQESLIWGDLETPVRIQVNPEINHDILEMTRKSILPLL